MIKNCKTQRQIESKGSAISLLFPEKQKSERGLENHSPEPSACETAIMTEHDIVNEIRIIIENNAGTSNGINGANLGILIANSRIGTKFKKLPYATLKKFLSAHPDVFRVIPVVYANGGSGINVSILSDFSDKSDKNSYFTIKSSNDNFELALSAKEIKVGTFVLAKIRNYSHYGFFVNFFGLTGLVHSSKCKQFFELSYQFLHPKNSYILLQIIDLALDENKVWLSVDTVPSFSARQEFENLAEKKVNILLVGGTGSGKSSLINAMISVGSKTVAEIAKIGKGCDPETNSINSYQYKKLTFIDTPGVGDSPENDKQSLKQLKDFLANCTKWESLVSLNSSESAIQVLMVVINAGSRDYGAEFELLKVLENLQNFRVLWVVNRIDETLQRPAWDFENKCPTISLQKAIKDKLLSVEKRFNDATGLHANAFGVASGYSDEFNTLEPYNINELMSKLNQLIS